MLNLVVREAAPVVAKAVVEVAVDVIKNNPGKSLAAAILFCMGYEKGRADTYRELVNGKRVQM